MAIWNRKNYINGDLVHHSDRGVQYTSIRYTERLDAIGGVRSVGSKGDSYDNAAAESVNSLYKKELIEHEGPWQRINDVMLATLDWVSWYNNKRLHSYCGNKYSTNRIRRKLLRTTGRTCYNMTTVS